MMYKLEPEDVDDLVQIIEKNLIIGKRTRLDGLLETFKSIQAVMVASSQSCVYIVGRDPNKL